MKDPNKLPRAEWIIYVNSQKDLTEKWQEAWTEIARDRVHNLDLSIPDHREIYNSTLRTHIMFCEVLWYFAETNSEEFDFIDSSEHETFQLPRKPIINLKVYEDNKGLRTIGIGFNMDRPEAKAEWEAALGKDISFDKHSDLKTKIPITDGQAYKLLDYSIKVRDQELRRKFRVSWDLLKPNEKITITSMYYNAGILIGPKITSHIKQYIKTQDKQYLEKAFFEVKHQSNPKKRRDGTDVPLETRISVQKRMDRESSMLESYNCPLYSRPGENPIPENSHIKIIPGKTVIPRFGTMKIDKNELDNYGNKKPYYIWRTQADDKVRMKHEFFEGIIFHIDHPPAIGHPGEDYNCRCVRDFNIPDFVQVKKYKGEMVRKFITDLFEIPDFCTK